MIYLHFPLKIEPDPQGGWQLVFWLGEAFDYTTPFRSMLAAIAQAIGCDRGLDLPPYEEGEDFIEGTLQFEADPLRIYYEHSIGYLSIRSDTVDVLHDLIDRLKSSIAVAETDEGGA